MNEGFYLAVPLVEYDVTNGSIPQVAWLTYRCVFQDMETKNPSSAVYFYDRDGKILVRTDQIERIRVLEKTMERLESLLERTVNWFLCLSMLRRQYYLIS